MSLSSEAHVADFVKSAKADRAPILISGGNTRAGLGRPVQAARTLSTKALSGITLYEPAEMVIGAKSGTPLAEIEAALSAKGQMLPFEPMDHRTLYGTSGTPTIGAVAAANISGPRRLWGGACRDSLIGVRFVNGLGEVIKSGGRVMKNVTGLDLVKLQAGAHGTLGPLTEVIFRVVPKVEQAITLTLSGLSDADAIRAMITAITSPFEITGAAHDPARALTALRIEGFGFSVDYRAAELSKLLAGFGSLKRVNGAESEAFWRDIRDCAPLATPHDRAIWRLSVKPTEAAKAVAAIRTARAIDALYDWGGGLVWIATTIEGDAGAQIIRNAARAASGYATLVRAPDVLRAAIPVFEPAKPGIGALEARIRTSIDPEGHFNPGRMA